MRKIDPHSALLDISPATRVLYVTGEYQFWSKQQYVSNYTDILLLAVLSVIFTLFLTV